AGRGMMHTIVLRVGSDEALDFWADRLAGEGLQVERDGNALRFQDPEGLGLEIAAVETDDEPLIADHPDIPADLALQGFDSVRAYSDPGPSKRFLEETLAFEPTADGEWEVRGAKRGERLSLPPDYEHLRERVEPLLTPLPNPRELVKR